MTFSHKNHFLKRLQFAPCVFTLPVILIRDPWSLWCESFVDCKWFWSWRVEHNSNIGDIKWFSCGFFYKNCNTVVFFLNSSINSVFLVMIIIYICKNIPEPLFPSSVVKIRTFKNKCVNPISYNIYLHCSKN